MADLRTDYKDDLLDTSVNTQRKYNVVNNDDGTVSFVDATVYTQNGDTFGASDINAVNQNLTAENGVSFNFAYNEETNEYGYMAKVEGADTFFPFKNGADIEWLANTSQAKYYNSTTSGSISETYVVAKNANHILVFVSTSSARIGATRSVTSNNSASTVTLLKSHSTSSGFDYSIWHTVYNYTDVYLIENVTEGDTITVKATVSAITDSCVTQIGEIVYID